MRRSAEEALSALTPEQRAAFEVLLRRQRPAAPGPGTEPIPRRADPSTHPLSFAQQRLWFLDQLAPGDPAYNIHGALRLRGPLRPAALRSGLSAAAARHEPLRARFAAVGGRPEQIVDPPGEVALPLLDLRALPEAVREAEVRRLAVEASRRSFDLARGPLLRAALLWTAPEEAVLLVAVHHIAADGWSIGILFRELAAFYGEVAGGPPADLPALPVSYADFAAWQRERLQGERLAREVEHWRARLAGMPELRLPTERGQADEGSRGAAVPVAISPALTHRLKAVGRSVRASLFMTLLAALQALLSRWTGQLDFGVGTPVANRTRPEIEGLVGFFVNMLVLRADLSGDPSFLELLERVERTAVEAFAHQELPFEKLVEELQPERRLGRSPLFAAALVLQNLPDATARLPGLEVEPLPVRNGTARFDLSLTLREEGHGLAGDLELRLEALTPLAARRLAGHLRVLLEAIVDDPGRPVAALPLLTGAERHQILSEWTGPERPLPAESLPELIARQAARSPEAVAVVCGDASITYGDLDRRADRLAHWLCAHGAGPETVVAISVERSVEMVVGLLGILKAGAAYLPIDPLNPRERQAFLLEDGGASILLTQEKWVGGLTGEGAPPPSRRVLCLDADRGEIERAEDFPLPRMAGQDNVIAYLYTSGSTGRPKATVLEARGLLNLCRWYVQVAPIRPQTRSLLGLSFSFDAAFKNLIGPLLAGGRVVLPPPGPFDAGEMLAAIRRHAVTFLCTTPGQFGPILQLAAAEGWEGLERLETLILTGEAARWAELRPWLRSGRCRAEILNMYGPSEASDTVSCHRATAGEILAMDRLPVGRPADNTCLLVVDANLKPLPAGVPGELCLAGVGLARGYHARPGLTAEKFVPSPWGRGERMYRTGDLARWQPDGSVEVLGRIDHQVKIRGVRVEPPEVETALAAHPAVRGAVVAARDDLSGGKRLVAWIVPAPGVALPPAGALRDFLRERLPDVMIPAAFVRLDAFPVTPRGKIDREALPDPEQGPAEAKESPRDVSEEMMAELWADVLGREGIGRSDDFFALGGHSLLATRLAARIRAAFGVDLPVRQLFEHPTLAALTAEVGRLARNGLPGLPPPRPRPDRGSQTPLSFAQRRLWVLHEITPDLTAYHLPAALRLRGPLDRAALERALGEIVRRHEALRTSFPVVDGEPVQSIAPFSGLSLSGADLAALPEDRREAEARRIGTAAAGLPFDLRNGPLLRLLLLRLGPAEHVLLLVVHHLVSDGWSLAVFLRELSALYAAFVRGLPSPLPEPSLQYADWALWQQESIRGAALDAQLHWWRDRLESAPRAIDLPTDFPHPPLPSHAGAAVPVRLPAALVAGVRRLGRQEDRPATLFMVLLAAFQALLARFSGQETVATGTHMAGRGHLESEDLIGFFVNTLVIRTDLDGEPSGRRLVARVREEVLGAFAHQDVPFERLVEALHPARDLRRSPLFQVAFTLQNLPRQDLRLPEVEAELVEPGSGAAQYELSLTLTEAGPEVAGALRYDTGLFREPTVRRMAGQYERLLGALVEAPEAPVSTLPLLTRVERQQILSEWTGPERPLPAESLPELIARQAARSPETIAVVCGDASIGYGDLDRRANQLAGWLRAQGAGPETVVAISVERSVEMVVGLLGILKAGTAYLPVDPLNPRERQAFLLEDGGAEILLTQEKWVGSLTGEGATPPFRRVLCLDAEWGVIEREEDSPPSRVAGQDNVIAYLYTSGSTGRPKATVLEARGLLNLCRWYVQVAPIRPHTRSLLGLSFSFDAAFKNLIGPLLAGGRVVLPPPGPFDAGEMLAAIRRHAVTFLCTTPGQFGPILQLASAEGWEGLETLETLILTGEAARWAELRPWLRSGRCRPEILNMYGPSEASDTVSCHRATADEILTMDRLPVGRPADNMRLLVVDAGLQPLPVGVPGELCLAGAGLARGYHARPGLTAEKFVPGPWGRGERMYRTGDLARWRPDGSVEVLGRIDHQVKIRGVRVEPPEVEAALAAHPAVRAAVVGARDEPSGGKRLIAWIVPAPGAVPPSAAVLRDFLRERLPDVMIPATFIPLASLPVTPRGKIDRGALPWDQPTRDQPRWDQPPRDPAEELMAGLWADVLGREGIGRGDDFFALGGHSLLATRLVTRIRAAFGVDLPVRRLFEHPTLGALTDEVRQLARHALPPIPPPRPGPDRRQGGVAPVSLAQRRLWVLHQITPGLTAYHIPAALRLRGRLAGVALERALGEIERRHETLRTSFRVAPVADAEPIQVIAPARAAADLRLPRVDLSALPEERRESAAGQLGAEAAARPFDLEKGPLVRLLLLRLGAEEHVLVLVVHHLVSDGWSTSVFLRELSALYAAFVQGLPSPLPEPPIQYADWALWQRETLRGKELEAQLRWWRDRLQSAPRVLDLPHDFPRPPAESHAGAVVPVRLPEELAAGLRRLGRAEGGTLFMVLLAAFQLLLSRLSREETVCAGTHVAGRDRLESEELIGFFVNTLVIRTDLEGDPTGRELIARVREAVLGAFAHQDLPFEKLVEALNPARELGGSPLFQAAFTLQNMQREDLHLPGLDAEVLEVDTDTAQYDLSLTLAEKRGGEIAGALRYRTALFAEPTVRRLVRIWETCLERLVAEPGTPVGDLSILSTSERRQILEVWSRRGDELPREICLHERFALQAARAPEAVALVEGEVAIPYRELDRRSARLARELRAAGAGPDVPVAVLLERSADLVVAMLGVVRAGAAYVPLDLGYPAERLAWMLEDSGARVIVTRGDPIQVQGPGAAALQIVRIDRIDALPAGDAAEPPALALSPDHLAFLLYTSGTTGLPKGVALTHRGVARLVIDPGYMELGPQETILQLAPVAFDASTFEIWGALLNGGRLVLFPPGPVSLHEVAEALRRHRVTTLFLATGLFHQMIDEEPQGLVGLRQLMTGGDVVSVAHARRALEMLPGCRLLHAYGPTEATTYVTCHPVAPEDTVRPTLTLGRPIPGAGVWLLDGRREPVPPGVPGELYLGGDGLARGYWRRPELTAERFVPHPFAAAPGERLYRTGDLARWRPDGTIDFLGRIDRQVKIRGFRIEPAEIEASLERHPGVAAAVVEPRGDGRGNKRIVAWIVPAAPASSEMELLAWCRDHLPPFMVPAAFVPLPALPLDPNGKVDRRALPEPQWRGRGFVLPQTPEEEWVASVWSEVLGAEPVGVEDDFFELGGHSLLAARLISRLRAAFGVDLPVRALFEHPTVGALAAEIRRATRAGLPALPPPRLRPPGAAAPLSFAQRRLWVLHQIDPGLIAYHIPAVLRLRGPLDVSVLARVLGEIVRRHEALRTSFPVVDGEPVQIVAPAMAVPLPGADLGSLPADRRDAEVLRVGEAAVRLPFDLERGPLLRLLLLRLGPEEHVLVLVVHHLVFDGWSTAVLLRELSVLYGAFLCGLPSPLPDPGLQPADWAIWQRETLQGEVLEEQLRWWQERLGTAPRVLDLPTDFPRPPFEAQAGASVPVRLPAALTGRLRQLGLADGATLFMVLLAGFQALLSRLTGEETVCTGTHVAGRSRLESEELIGFFVNTLVMRTDLDGDPSGRDLIARVRDMVLGAFAHQDLPFERLVEALQPPRQPGVPPLFQVSFTLQNAPRDDLRLPGLEVDLLEVATGTTQLDLSLVLAETPGGLAGTIRYRTALFAEPTVRRLAGHYENLLAALAAGPETRVSAWRLLTAAERHQILAEWSGPERGMEDRSLPELFAEQAARTPEAVAVVCGEASIPYGELDRRSSRLARWLCRAGAGPETAVAISVERSVEMIVGLLGILKAGAAYLPIDPLNPRERQAFLLEDGGASVLLTQEKWAAGFTEAEGASRRVLCLDADWGEVAREGEGPLPRQAGPENLLALLYTSGSTGRPKATALAARGLLNLCLWYRDVCPITPHIRTLLGYSFSFDAAFKNIIVPLLAGGRVVLPPPGPFDAGEMLDAIRREGINFLSTTPSQMVPILERAAAEEWAGLEGLETLILGGEAAPWAELRPWLRSGRCRAQILNMYGPSEVSDTVSCHRATAEEVLAADRLPVGRAADNTRMLVVDAVLEPLPLGVPGELCLAGIGVARGYLGRPALTAERFVPDPFHPGERMYRTGDLARWRPDGSLEILGRIDHQVKIRGIRVEPHEVEMALLAHPAVAAVVVGARDGAAGARRLIAWIVPEGGVEPPRPVVLRDFLRRRLPEVMIPAVFVFLSELPVTPRGKLDRRALPDPPRQGAGTEAPARPAFDWIEIRLRRLFREVLDVDRVDASDSFFDLGGHSMTAFRLATRIREAFGVRLAVSRLFSDPTPAALAEVIRGMERDSPGLPPIRRIPRDRPLPLSLAQQRLWVLHQLTPGLTTYHIPAGLRLRGLLDVPALRGALTEILRRHEALRTCFPLVGAEPVQRIDPPPAAPLPVLDLAVLPEAEREAEARRVATAEALRPFDLERGPLLRLALLRLGAEEHILLLVVHHLVSDGWSTALFLRELSALYEAALRREPSPLAEPRVQYADWAVWQREQLQGEVLDAHLHWWTERLAGAPRVLELPTDRPRPAVEDPAGASVPLSLPKPLVESLRQLAQAEGATLYMTLLAGFQALLARIAGQETVSVGTHVARRNRLEVEGLIGFFVNTVVIRADVTGASTGRELVHQVRDSVFGAFAHQDLPFERLVEALGLERDPRWSPLFQVSFALQNVPHEEPRLPGLDVESLGTDTGAAHFDLAATLTESPRGEAVGALSYRTALFFDSTIQRLAGHYEVFLEALAAHPDAPLATHALLTAAERHQILIEWAGPERGYPGQGLPELFAAQAARTPDAIAAVCGAESITYGDLHRRSGRLARWLRRHGIGPETAVAISVERSVEMMVGLLGILEAGAAYLPIDPLNPRERQAFLLEDAGVPILLTQQKWAGGFTAPGRLVVCLDEPLEESAAAPPRIEASDLDNIQALLYTSGSTGRPKATVLEARGLLNLCLWHRDVCPVLPHTRSLLGFSFSFDAAFKHLVVPLLVGGRVVLAPPGPFDAGEMLEALRREAVTLFHTTPSQMLPILQQAAQEDWRGLETLETLILGGEATPWAELRPWLASGRCRAEILHTYGPSEVSDTVSCHRATHAEIAQIEAGDRLPAGRAADNIRLMVMDAGLQPLPIGVPGELCLAGDGVARGYLGRPALTAEKLVPDPFHPGARMYRTGDLARWRADGSVEILGRIDHQVKIRGIRVEPPEVEAALATHPAVGGVVVGAREDASGAPGEKRLIAWIVPAEGAEPPAPALLREHLRERLPEAMIPAAFVLLPAFPVTPRGKIDRNALPDPGAPPRDERALVPPRDEMELRLALLFQEVLGGEVGIRDSFFDRGGHSLAAVRLAVRIREELGVPFPVADLFLAPTVEELARLLRQKRKPEASRLVPLHPSGDREPLFLLPPGGGNVFGYLELVRRLDASRPVYGLRAQGLEAGEEPLREVEAMADQYLAEIRRVQPQGPWRLAGWSFGGLVAFEMAKRLRAAGEGVAVLALIDPTDPADIEPAPDGELDLSGLLRELGLPLEGIELTPDERALPPEARLSVLFAKAKEAGLLRPGDQEADLRRRFEVFRASAGAARAYRLAPCEGPVDLLEPATLLAPKAGNWRPLARSVQVLPGDHFSLLLPPHVDALAAALRALLA